MTSPLAKDLFSLDIVIGVNTGEVITLRGKNYDDVWGENVVIAEKLQKECLNYDKQNLISEFTYQAIKEIIPAEKVSDILIKDRQIGVYELLVNTNGTHY
jgi:class 3 adenylate cyclase